MRNGPVPVAIGWAHSQESLDLPHNTQYAGELYNDTTGEIML
jgi:hypothetical protein